MEKFNLNNIKPENIKNVFNAVVNCDSRISRADIAAKTNLSIMTVGKIIDAFITHGILLQSKEIKDSAGRKARLVMLNPARTARIIDGQSTTIVDFCLNPVEKETESYGTGVIETDLNCAARSLTQKYRAENILHLRIDDKYKIRSSLIFGGKAVNRVANINTEELSHVIQIISGIVPLDYVVFECKADCKLPQLEIPKIVISDEPILHSHRGMAMKLRDLWFENLL